MSDRERESRKRRFKERVIIGSKTEEEIEESREEGRKPEVENSLSIKGVLLPSLLILFCIFVLFFSFMEEDVFGKNLYYGRKILKKQRG